MNKVMLSEKIVYCWNNAWSMMRSCFNDEFCALIDVLYLIMILFKKA